MATQTLTEVVSQPAVPTVAGAYRAFRDRSGGGVVLREAVPATAGADVLDVSPRVDWGRDSPAARQLAWMLLLDASENPRLADDWHDSFFDEVVVRLPERGFVLRRDDIRSWLDSSPAAA